MCFESVRAGGRPACVEACPHEALEFGQRSSLLERAHRRLAGNPGRYLPHVWGEEEFGGTSVLYLSGEDLAQIDWPAPSFEPIPELTEPLIAGTPFIGLAVASGMLGINWIIRRRMKLATLEGGGTPAGGHREPEDATDDE